jgi:hypothetical protein
MPGWLSDFYRVDGFPPRVSPVQTSFLKQFSMFWDFFLCGLKTRCWCLVKGQRCINPALTHLIIRGHADMNPVPRRHKAESRQSEWRERVASVEECPEPDPLGLGCLGEKQNASLFYLQHKTNARTHTETWTQTLQHRTHNIVECFCNKTNCAWRRALFWHSFTHTLESGQSKKNRKRMIQWASDRSGSKK